MNVKPNRYANNKMLNNESYGWRLAADWTAVDRWSGTVSLAADRRLAQFNNRTSSGGTVETKKNTIHTARADAGLRLALFMPYALEATVGYRQVDYPATEYQRSDYQQTSGSLGRRYRPRTALDLGLALRLSQAKYPRFVYDATSQTCLADSPNRQDIDFTDNGVPHPLRTVDLRLSPTRTSCDCRTGGDFSGLTGSDNWAWQPTGKSWINSTLWRDTGQSSCTTSVGFAQPGVADYSQIASLLRFSGEQDVTGKIAAIATLTDAHRSLVDTVRETLRRTSHNARGNDNTIMLVLSGNRSFTRSAQVGGELGSEQHSASNNQRSVPLPGNSVSRYGQIVLQCSKHPWPKSGRRPSAGSLPNRHVTPPAYASVEVVA